MSKHILTSYDSWKILNEEHGHGLTAREKVKAAIGMIFINSQFFGPILLRLWIIQDNSPHTKTMYTNGSVIAYSPKFVDKLTVGETAWVLIHEIMHNILLHFSRMKPNRKLWNCAADYAINILIKDIDPKFKMVKGGLYDEQYKGLPAEVIYEELLKNPNKIPQDYESCGDVTDEDIEIDPNDVVQHGMGGDGEDEEDDKDDKDGSGAGAGDGDGDEDGSAGEEDDDKKASKGGQGKKIVIKKATDTQIQSTVSSVLSKMPDAIRRYYDSLFKAQVDWKKELKKYIKDSIDGIKYKLPYRRFAHTGTYISGPIRKADILNKIVIIIDTSGSVDDEMIKTFMGEVCGVLAAYPVELMYILSADEKVRTVNTLKNPRLLGTTIISRGGNKKIDIKGGLGTDFRPGFEWIDKELKGNPNIVIYLTDLEGTFPAKPKYDKKVIWCTIKDHVIPFGKKINIKE
jgi:predicted metal-dependent peptidase